MNLIEQLGGYEKSKMELQLKEEGSIFQCCTAITVDMIRNALLEYRRAHNIFEKGDWIVNTKTGAFGDFIKFADTKNGHKHCLVDIGLCDTALFCIKNIRHATDLEIEAGRRL